MYIHSIFAVFKNFVLSYHVEIGITQYLMTQLIALYYSEAAKNSHTGNSSKDTRMEWLDYALITVEISLDPVEYLLSCWDLGPEVFCIIHSLFFGASREGQLWCWSHRTIQIPVLEHNPQTLGDKATSQLLEMVWSD